MASVSTSSSQAQAYPPDGSIIAGQASAEEVAFYAKIRPFDAAAATAQLPKDIGEEDAAKVLKRVSDACAAIGGSSVLAAAIGPLHWPGVSSRWAAYAAFVESPAFAALLTTEDSAADAADGAVAAKHVTAEEVFTAFSETLGRVRSYRALSLLPEQWAVIEAADSIYPTGRLRHTEAECVGLVQQLGARAIARARLYIGRRLMPFDPSLSLHDDPETALVISGGYLRSPGQTVYLMEMDVPVIEPLGYRVADVADDASRRWFEHRGCYFNAQELRCERYCLFEIPMLRARMKALRKFTQQSEIDAFVAPFVARQGKRRAEDSEEDED